MIRRVKKITCDVTETRNMVCRSLYFFALTNMAPVENRHMVNTNPIFYDSMTLIKPLLKPSKRTTHVHILCTPESPNDGVLQSANFFNSWPCQSCRTKQLKEQCKHQCKCNCQCKRKWNGKCTFSWHLLCHSFAGCKLLKQLALSELRNQLFHSDNAQWAMYES